METMQYTIVKQAEDLFMQYGIRSVSIDDICRKLTISKKTFYLYFKQKEDLVDKVLYHQEQKMVDLFSKQTKGKNSIETLLFYITEAKRFSNKNEKTVILYDLEKYYSTIAQNHQIRRSKIFYHDFRNNLELGIKEGFYRTDMDIEMISAFFCFQHRHIVEQMKLHSKSVTNKRLLDFFIDLIMRLIVSEKGRAYLEEMMCKNEK